MTTAARDLLDDGALVETADPSGILRQVATSAAQVRTAVREAEDADLSRLEADGRPRAIVVAGMGGSGIAGEVLAAVCGPGCPVQIATMHDYRLPGWVGAADLVAAVSCSGSTEETLATVAEAVRRGCRVLAVGAAGSPLASIAEQANAAFIPVKSAGMPRTTLWGLSVPLVVAASRLGVVDMPAGAFESAAAELERVSHLCRPGSDAFVNPGKALALELSGTLPLIWGSSQLAGVAAYRLAGELNENANYPAVAGVLPEANHNQVCVFDGPFAPRADRGLAPRFGGDGQAAGLGGGPDGSQEQAWMPAGKEPAVPLRLVILRDNHEHPQVARRRDESIRLAEDRGIGVSEIAAAGDGPLERLASLAQLGDYASVYLAIAHGIDPAPIAAIQDLKARVSDDLP